MKRGATTIALDEIDRGVLLTVLYADLFDYPLTRTEIHRRLVAVACDRSSLDASVRRLDGCYLEQVGEYVTWAGRGKLVGVRERRERVAEKILPVARRYARWLARMPFVRMVAVSGSLAVRNSEASTDIDLFCITEENRLWLARCCIVPFAKLTRRLTWVFPRYLCANTMVSLAALEIDHRSLYTASEVAQALPICGNDVYRLFVSANAWAYDLLPQMGATTVDDALPADEEAFERAPARRSSGSVLREHPPALTRAIERVCAGRLGDWLDATAHGLFAAFYRVRAKLRREAWAELSPAYRRQRYSVPRGGYLPVVRRLFLERWRERLGETIDDAEISRLFPMSSEATRPGLDWEHNFSREYGAEWASPEVDSPPTPQ